MSTESWLYATHTINLGTSLRGYVSCWDYIVLSKHVFFSWCSSYAGKKYKPVEKKIRPVATELLEQFHITQNIQFNPLSALPDLPIWPTPFEPTKCYTVAVIDAACPGDFLWPEEWLLLHRFMLLHQDSFAWDNSEQDHFKEEFFLPIKIPTIPHKPWAIWNLPIPPEIYDQICKLIRRKIEAGVFEPSNSSYQSWWFTVLKKDSTLIQIVQSLKPLNAVTIAHPVFHHSQNNLSNSLQDDRAERSGFICWLWWTSLSLSRRVTLLPSNRPMELFD